MANEWLESAWACTGGSHAHAHGGRAMVTQQCCVHCGVPGTDHGQYAYKTECAICGYVYGPNGADMHKRLCPECKGGVPGIRYWKVTEK